MPDKEGRAPPTTKELLDRAFPISSSGPERRKQPKATDLSPVRPRVLVEPKTEKYSE